MGLFDIFKKGKSGQFVTESEYRNNTDIQLKLAPKTLGHLRGIGVDPEKKLKLEYFFYTNTVEKAAQFANHLQNMNYTADFGESASDKTRFIVKGWTTDMPMDDTTVQAWTKQMCELGFTFDCEFDGWGTTPDQD
jgi:hypothetical protein